MKMRLLSNSLKKQLLFYLLVSSLTIWGITAYVGYFKTREQINELFNADLAQSARVAHSFIETMLQNGSLEEHWPDGAFDVFPEYILGHRYERKIAFQLWSIDNGIVLRSESAPRFVLSQTENGYSQTMIEDQLWHVFSITDDSGEYVVHVGQRDDLREQLAQDISLQLIQQFLLALPVLGLVIWFIVSRTLSPVQQLRRQLASRQATFLEPLPLEGLPEEILPLVEQLNTLFDQLEQAFENERNFTSDASHELRTPLAGLLTQVQVAQKATDETIRQGALQQAQNAVQRMTRMVQQLLTLSRIQHQRELVDRELVDLDGEIINAIADIEPIAYAKHIDIAFYSAAQQQILGNSQLIAVLLRNLLENAVKYSPANGKIRVSSVRDKNRLWLHVEDSGPGIAEDHHKRITQRFYRCVETAAVQGSGLGLSIVQRITRLHGATLSFDKSTLGGLAVHVAFEL